MLLPNIAFERPRRVLEYASRAVFIVRARLQDAAAAGPLNSGVGRHMKYLALITIVMAWPARTATPEGFPLASGTYMFQLVDLEYSHGKHIFIYGRASVIFRDSQVTILYLGNNRGYKWGDIIEKGQLKWSDKLNAWAVGDEEPEDGCPTIIDPARHLVFTC